MTPALSILCAVLAAGLFWLSSCMKHDRAQFAEILDAHYNQIRVLRETRAELMEQSETDAALLAEAHALLHDTAARGKDGRWLPWSERRAAWVKKCEVRG